MSAHRHAAFCVHFAHPHGTLRGVIVLKSVALFVLAALLEIGGAWLVCKACANIADGYGQARV